MNGSCIFAYEFDSSLNPSRHHNRQTNQTFIDIQRTSSRPFYSLPNTRQLSKIIDSCLGSPSAVTQLVNPGLDASNNNSKKAGTTPSSSRATPTPSSPSSSPSPRPEVSIVCNGVHDDGEDDGDDASGVGGKGAGKGASSSNWPCMNGLCFKVKFHLQRGQIGRSCTGFGLGGRRKHVTSVLQEERIFMGDLRLHTIQLNP